MFCYGDVTLPTYLFTLGLFFTPSSYRETWSVIWDSNCVSGHLIHLSPIFTLQSCSSVFGFHQLLRELCVSSAATCTTVFTNKSQIVSVCCLELSRENTVGFYSFSMKTPPAAVKDKKTNTMTVVNVNQNSKADTWVHCSHFVCWYIVMWNCWLQSLCVCSVIMSPNVSN